MVLDASAKHNKTGLSHRGCLRSEWVAGIVGIRNPEFLDDIRSTGIPIIELGAYLESLKAEGIDPFYYRATRLRGHWNHATHERIGWFLSQQIIKRGGFGILGKPKAMSR